MICPMELIPFSVFYWFSCYLSLKGQAVISACLLIVTGAALYIYNFRKYSGFLTPSGLFSVSWICCIGLACLKLSNLQSVWSVKTWLCFYLIYVSFVLLFRFAAKNRNKSLLPAVMSENPLRGRDLYSLIIIFTLISVISFITEALILRYIPLFTTDTPHAYSYFHVSGLHYFTVLCVLVPSLAVLYLDDTGKDKRFPIIILCTSVCLFLPILLVSRFQLVFSVLLAFVCLMLLHESDRKFILNRKFILPVCLSLVCLIALYVFITVERAHSIEYLNGIFEMKDSDTPIFITQPYIYVVNNFENFDCLIKQLEHHTYGLRSAYPFFALTGLKFLKPGLVSFPLYLTKEELTTVTMFYDVYYDFGIPGCVIFAGLLGLIFKYLYLEIRTRKHAFSVFIGAQLTSYLILAFFTTWFSNPTTWFYFGISIVSGLLLWYINYRKNGMKRDSIDMKGNRNG